MFLLLTVARTIAIVLFKDDNIYRVKAYLGRMVITYVEKKISKDMYTKTREGFSSHIGLYGLI